ncbi:MAG: hypothetical protein WCW27_02050 [Patescibacteria group bacterium]|jgi:hypothetical protein
MALLALQQHDIIKRLNRAGVTETVRAAQVIEATKLFISSELPDYHNELIPQYVRQQVLVIQSANSIAAHLLKQQETLLFQYIKQACSVTIQRLQFKI